MKKKSSFESMNVAIKGKNYLINMINFDVNSIFHKYKSFFIQESHRRQLIHLIKRTERLLQLLNNKQESTKQIAKFKVRLN